MSTTVQYALAILTLAVVVVTVLPFSSSHRWWVRGWDFPRLQILIVTLPLLLAAIFWGGAWRWYLAVPLALCGIYQAIRIFPYTILMPKEMRQVARTDGDSQVSLMSSNVEMPNDKYDRVARVIAEERPDVLFLMETDAKWQSALAEVLEPYETVLAEIRDNYYGMIFATNLPVRRAEVVYLTGDDTPTLFAELESRGGHVFRVVGLHPRPPVPGNDTRDRDAEMLYAARFARKRDIPLITVGDFNDAAWSDTSRRFKKVGGYLDPRVGYGMVASFDANSRLLRAPIDQFYATPEIAVAEFRRGPNVGSDHFPMIVRIELDPEKAKAANNAPSTMSPRDIDDIDRIFEEYRQNLGAERYDE